MSCFSAHSLSPLQLLELIAKSQLPALSGVAQKNYMNILERVVQKGELRQSFFVAKSHPAGNFVSEFIFVREDLLSTLSYTCRLFGALLAARSALFCYRLRNRARTRSGDEAVPALLFCADK